MYFYINLFQICVIDGKRPHCADFNVNIAKVKKVPVTAQNYEHLAKTQFETAEKYFEDLITESAAEYSEILHQHVHQENSGSKPRVLPGVNSGGPLG